MKRATLLAAVFLGLAGWATGQAPSGTTFVWKKYPKPGVQPPVLVSCPIFVLDKATNKTMLDAAVGTLTIPAAAGPHSLTKVQFRVHVDAGGGVWNPVIDQLGISVAGAQNTWDLSGSDTNNPKIQFDQTKDVRIEFEVVVKPVPTQQNPNPPSSTFVVGTWINKPVP